LNGYKKNEILSPRSDLIFKMLFGDERNSDLLISFLKAALTLPHDEYDQVTIVDPHLPITHPDDKRVVLDVKLKTKSGKLIDIEIQVSSVPQMRERIVFYTSKMITEQVSSADKYDKVKKVISIIITDYVLIRENDSYKNTYTFYDKKTGSTFSDIIEIHTLELPKLPKDGDNTNLWNWLQFLNAKTKEELVMLEENSPQLKKAVVTLMKLSEDERTRLLNESYEKAARDALSREDYAMEIGIERGRKEGIEEGMEMGIEEGIEKGILLVAKKALKRNLSIEEIEELTGLSREEIENLK
jgi:predicted transposase/invertase (TIGR01784 family)